MSGTLLTSLIAASGALIVGLASVVVNSIWMARPFDGLTARLTSFESRLTSFESRVDSRLSVIEAVLKQFYKEQSKQLTDVALIRNKLGMSE